MRRRRVAFKICDIYFPEPREVLSELYGACMLRGMVVDLTDRNGDRLAVIEIEGEQKCVVVPVRRIREVT